MNVRFIPKLDVFDVWKPSKKGSNFSGIFFKGFQISCGSAGISAGSNVWREVVVEDAYIDVSFCKCLSELFPWFERFRYGRIEASAACYFHPDKIDAECFKPFEMEDIFIFAIPKEGVLKTEPHRSCVDASHIGMHDNKRVVIDSLGSEMGSPNGDFIGTDRQLPKIQGHLFFAVGVDQHIFFPCREVFSIEGKEVNVNFDRNLARQGAADPVSELHGFVGLLEDAFINRSDREAVFPGKRSNQCDIIKVDFSLTGHR